ncbi:HIT family protein [Patescibacteria group bacterium]|nr:HIT family protein [Patescibacteria group bacterium]
MDCLFCKICAKTIDSDIVYEDEKVIAFLDINPVNPGHVLVLPKIHVEHLVDLSDEDILPVMKVVKKIMKALMSQSDVEGINILQNNYSAAGQVVPHVHFHVIPRKQGDGHRHWPGTAYQEGESAIMAERIKSAL